MDKIDICNLALANIGTTKPISLFTDMTPEAIVCNRFYDICRQSLLTEFSWGFAVGSKVLELLSEDNPRYAYVYEYPSDALRVMSVGTGDEPKRNDFEIIYTAHERRIVTDVADARAEYLVDLVDTGLFSPKFIEALAWKISAAIAIPLSKDANVAKYAQQMAAGTLAEAKHKSALERTKPPEKRSTWLAARM